MGFRIVDKSLAFVTASTNALDRALNNMAIDVERLSKAQVPFKHGQLKASGYHRKDGKLKYIVGFDKEYAAYQEWGGATDKNGVVRVVRKYSASGKGKFYLADPIKLVTSKAYNYFEQQINKIKIM
jgi:hypothetical protein